MDVEVLSSIAETHGIWALFDFVFGFALYQMWKHMTKSTVPRDVHERVVQSMQSDMINAITANTEAIKILGLKIEERIPKRGG
jgi:hypothetical protein